ncbi:hypothetical protein JRF79_12775, partial [Micrococcus luteus]|nr:hypothetical protein [Micrococcus luteus]
MNTLTAPQADLDALRTPAAAAASARAPSSAPRKRRPASSPMFTSSTPPA